MKQIIAAILKGAYDEVRPGNKRGVRNEAYRFILSEDCQYMCECVDVSYSAYKEKALKEFNKL